MTIYYPSWEVFDECDTCCAKQKDPCYDLRSTSKALIHLTNPHKGRRKLPKDSWHSELPV